MSWPDSWAGSSASARFGHHLLFASRAQTCAPPAGGARRVRSMRFGAGLRPPTGPHPVRPSVRRARSRGACPSDLVSHSLVRESDALGAPRLGVHLLLRACLLMRCPGGDALSPRALRLRPAFQPGHPAWASPLRPAPGSADRMTVRGRPVARLGPSPSVRPGRATVHSYKGGKTGRTWSIRTGENSGSYGETRRREVATVATLDVASWDSPRSIERPAPAVHSEQRPPIRSGQVLRFLSVWPFGPQSGSLWCGARLRDLSERSGILHASRTYVRDAGEGVRR